MVINFKPSIKQKEMFDAFNDDVTTEVIFGGALLTGKSYSAAALLVMKCLQHAGIRVGIARNNLTTLKKTSVVTIIKLLGEWGLKPEEHYNYNSQAGTIKFFNDSEIVLSELQYQPSDPDYTRLGGLELAFAVIDEAGEVDEKAKSIYQSRIGRWRNEEFGIKGFLLMTANPSKNFLFREYYIPFKEGTLKPHQKFIQALPKDNPYTPEGYIENLENTLTLNERRRLLQGDWELSDNPNTLIKYDTLQLAYDLSIELSEDTTPRMSVDVAFKSDQCVFVLWRGLTVTDIVTYNKAEDKTVEDKIKELAKLHKIKTSNISFDADGVGLYLHQTLPSAKEIHNNGKTIKNHGYKNLKTELYFKLSELMESGMIKFGTDKYRKEVEEESACIKHKDRSSMENKIELISKAEMKRELGRSPDYMDAIAYGMIWQLKNNALNAGNFVFANF